MPDVQNLFNAHLLGKAVGENGLPRDPPEQWRDTDLRESKQSRRGAAPPQQHRRLQRNQKRLWSNDQPEIFGYLQFLLSVQGAQAIHPSQEDPVAEKQGEKQHHQVLSDKTVTNTE